MIEELNGDFLQWLRGFYHVANTGSVRKAAQLMNRNPSTISYQLRCLEDELNVVLFDRFRRSMRITPEGRKLLDWTISTFETLKGLRASVSNAGGVLKGKIRLAATLPLLYLAAPAIKRFRQRFPQVEIFLEREIASTIRCLVNECEVDFGLMPAFRPMEGLEIIFGARPLLVFGSDWKFPDRPSVEDLRNLPFISFAAREDITNLGYYSLNSPLGELIASQTVLSVNNNQIMLRFVAEGLGLGIIDEAALKTIIKDADRGSVAWTAVDHLLPIRLYGIYTLHGKRMSPQSIELLKVLRAQLKSCAEMFMPCPGLERAGLEDGRSDCDGDGGRDEP